MRSKGQGVDNMFLTLKEGLSFSNDIKLINNKYLLGEIDVNAKTITVKYTDKTDNKEYTQVISFIDSASSTSETESSGDASRNTSPAPEQPVSAESSSASPSDSSTPNDAPAAENSEQPAPTA
ncbi:UNVERIFIED_CONTAM: hypothetical protein O8I53_10230 [Campylobacter lari]